MAFGSLSFFETLPVSLCFQSKWLQSLVSLVYPEMRWGNVPF